MLLDLDQVGDYFDAHFTRTAFRLEALDVYDVDSDGGDVAGYLSGEKAPDNDYKDGWLKQLADDTAAGKQWSRVHVLTSPLNDYLRYECEWGYAYNVAAGEIVQILDLAEQTAPDELIAEEFWLFDNQHILLMHYDDAGHFLGGEPLGPEHLPRYKAAAQAAQAAAVPFAEWWERHPNEHRSHWAAA